MLNFINERIAKPKDSPPKNTKPLGGEPTIRRITTDSDLLAPLIAISLKRLSFALEITSPWV
jgi:hypothetical protein